MCVWQARCTRRGRNHRSSARLSLAPTWFGTSLFMQFAQHDSQPSMHLQSNPRPSFGSLGQHKFGSAFQV